MAKYNGWTNRETWLVQVWFNPENQSDLDYIQETIERDVENIPSYLRDFCCISEINWKELSEQFETDEADDDDVE